MHTCFHFILLSIIIFDNKYSCFIENVQNDGIVSPLHSTSYCGENNKTATRNSPSPTKLRMSFTASTNLDKVIEAVSKGLMDDNHGLHVELKESRVEISPLKMPLVNGVQLNLNDTKVLLEQGNATVEVKTKASKKVKKEKEKEKDKEKKMEKEKKVEKDIEIEKEKVKDAEKEKDKDNEKDSKDKNKLREKLKRKTKVTPAEAAAAAAPASTELSSPQSTTEQDFKDEKLKSNEKDSAEMMHHDIAKIDNKIIGNSPDRCEVDTTIDSTNTNVLNASKDTKPTPENSLNGESANVFSSSIEGTVEGAATSTTTTTTVNQKSMERKLNRKHRKEKHRNKHGADAERSSSKEHKKKRKRKNHDHENTDAFPPAGSVPTIKIKV